MTVTIREVVNEALRIVGEVAGSGVQELGEDRVKTDAERAFDMLFKKRYWHVYCRWETVALDGVLGIPSTDAFEDVRDFEDFIVVCRNGEATGLPILPRGVNPNTVVSGSRVLYWTALHATNTHYTKRKLQFYPVAATGSVDVFARVYPRSVTAANWDWEDSWHLDKWMLAEATAYLVLAGDDLNPTAAEACRSMMEMRYRDIIAGVASHKIPVSGPSDIPREWSVQQ